MLVVSAPRIHSSFVTHCSSSVRSSTTTSRTLFHDVVNSIAVPLIRNGVALGCLGAYARSARTYDARDARALVAIAEIGALALENARFLADIQKARLESERLEEIGRAIS